jgi:cell division protein FtsX
LWSIFQAIKRSWTQHFVEQFSALIILTLSYVALLFIALSLTNIQILFDSWGQVNKVTVFLKKDVAQKVKDNLLSQLQNEPLVNQAQWVSPRSSAESFEKKFMKMSEKKIKASSMEKFFPSYIVLNLNQDLAYKTQANALSHFVDRIQSTYSGIQNVSFGKRWLNRYTEVLNAIHGLGYFLIFAFLVASGIVSSTIIKTVIHSRKEEIEIMEFIGADDTFIYLPHILNVVFVSFLAFSIALVFNIILFQQFKALQSDLFSPATLEQLKFLSAPIIFSLYALILVLVTLYSFVIIFNLLPRRKRALLINEVIR